MFDQVPQTFDTVVQRDLWLWKHLEANLLSQEDQERLVNMPEHDAERTTGTRWANYARTVAQSVGTRQCWEQAQAYWFATAFLLAHANKSKTSEFWEAAAEVLRYGGYAAGMLPTEEAKTVAEIVALGLKSSITPVPETIVRNLVTLGTIRDSIYEEADLLSESRRLYSQLLPSVYPQLKAKLASANGSHEQFRVAVSAYTTDISQLRLVADQWTENQTIEHMRRSRESLLKQLAKMNPYLASYDKAIISGVQSLLGAHFSSYAVNTRLKMHQ